MQRVLALPLVRIWQSPAMIFGEFIVGGGSPTFKVTRPPETGWPRGQGVLISAGLKLTEPVRAAHDAEPSQVCGLPAQHQPSLGLPSLSHKAGTRLSPQRDASREKHMFGCSRSGA